MNYQVKLEEILDKLNNTPKLLLHACCAPCSSYVLEYLSNYFEITILYYNPNIYPDIEYNRRYNELKNFIPKRVYKNKVELIELPYNDKEYYQAVRGLELLGEKVKDAIGAMHLEWKKVLSMLKNIIMITLQLLYQ